MTEDLIGRLNRIDYGNLIYFDSVTGIAGTTYPIGTIEMPSDVIADVLTICAARNIFNIYVHGALVIGAAMEHYCFIGNCHVSITDVVTLGGFDVDASRFDCLVITGAQGGTGYATCIDSILYAVTGFRGLASNCCLHTSIALAVGGATDYADFIRCHSIQGGVTVTVGAPDIVSFKDFIGSMILTVQTAGAVLLTGYKGDLEIDEMTGGTLDIYANGADITINADCTGGTIDIYGSAVVTDNSIGAVVNDYTEQDDRATETAIILAADMTLVTAFATGNLAGAGAEATLFTLDSVAGTKKDVKVVVQIDAATAGNIEERWYVNSLAAPAVFVLKYPTNAAHNPGAVATLTREFGDLPEGLQLQFRIHSVGNDAGRTYEAELTYLK